MSLVPNQLVPELSVTNFTKSLTFYTQILGFNIEYQREEEGFAFLIDELGKGRDWKTSELEYPLGRGLNLQLEVKSIDPILKKLKDANIELFMDVEEKWYRTGNVESGNRQFLVQDPDGYLLRFTEELGERPINK
jgi:catechol 2,3-dioxygenase-like lactoylglutathione lyase family enzyme